MLYFIRKIDISRLILLISMMLIRIDSEVFGQDNLIMKVEHISLTQSKMFSDSLVLNGSIGSSFNESGSGDTINLKSGLWSVTSGLFLLPPKIESYFPDSIGNEEDGIYAQAIVTDINGINSVDLHVQFGGQDNVTILPMESINDSTYRILIADSLKKIQNIRAQIVSMDGRYNEARTENNSPYLQFGKNELTMSDSLYSYYPSGLPSGRWRLFSFPGDLDSAGIKRYDLEKDGHVFYDWDPVNLKWFNPDSIELGRGYWFKHNYDRPVIFDNNDTTGYSIPLEDYTIILHQGANLVGSPFTFPVEATFSDGVSLPFKYGDDEKDGWADTVVFEPWAGYAVYSATDTGTITFQPNYRSDNSSSRTILDGWTLELNLSSDSRFDRSCAIGRRSYALEEIDIYDVPSLPSPDRKFGIALDIIEKDQYGHSWDIRSTKEFNGVWHIQAKIAKDNARLSSTLENPTPEGLLFALIDIQQRSVVEDFIQNGYEIPYSTSGSYELKIIAGDENYISQMIEEILSVIPEEYSLKQNYPNPFNPTTNIDFTVPATGPVELVIYNIMGQRIRTLKSGNIKYGYHSVQWNGLDDRGLHVASGVYFSELMARDFRQTRKMLLLK